jgi:hypothetical protein
MGTGSFPGVKSGRGVTLTPHPLLVPWPWKSIAIPLLPLWAVRPVHSLSACTRVHFTFAMLRKKLLETVSDSCQFFYSPRKRKVVPLHAMKAYGEWRNSSSHGCVWSVLQTSCFTPMEEPHGTGGWVHPRISLDTLLHHLESNNSFSTVQTLAYQASVITISITLGQKIYADIWHIKYGYGGHMSY